MICTKSLFVFSVALLMSVSFIPFSLADDGYISPKKQVESGIAPEDVQCLENRVLVIRANGSPACVTEKTAERMGLEPIVRQTESVLEESSDDTVQQIEQVDEVQSVNETDQQQKPVNENQQIDQVDKTEQQAVSIDPSSANLNIEKTTSEESIQDSITDTVDYQTIIAPGYDDEKLTSNTWPIYKIEIPSKVKIGDTFDVTLSYKYFIFDNMYRDGQVPELPVQKEYENLKEYEDDLQDYEKDLKIYEENISNDPIIQYADYFDGWGSRSADAMFEEGIQVSFPTDTVEFIQSKNHVYEKSYSDVTADYFPTLTTLRTDLQFDLQSIFTDTLTFEMKEDPEYSRILAFSIGTYEFPNDFVMLNDGNSYIKFVEIDGRGLIFNLESNGGTIPDLSQEIVDARKALQERYYEEQENVAKLNSEKPERPHAPPDMESFAEFMRQVVSQNPDLDVRQHLLDENFDPEYIDEFLKAYPEFE